MIRFINLNAATLLVLLQWVTWCSGNPMFAQYQYHPPLLHHLLPVNGGGGVGAQTGNGNGQRADFIQSSPLLPSVTKNNNQPFTSFLSPQQMRSQQMEDDLMGLTSDGEIDRQQGGFYLIFFLTCCKLCPTCCVFVLTRSIFIEGFYAERCWAGIGVEVPSSLQVS